MKKKSPGTLLQEIQQQATLFQDILSCRADRFSHLSAFPTETRKIVALAEGSSKHALEIAAPFLEAWLDLPMIVLHPEGLEEKLDVSRCYGEPEDSHPKITVPKLFEHSLLLIVSQSGETGSILRLLDTLKAEYGDFPGPIMTVTNRLHSSISEQYGNHLFIGAGEERSIAATKTMTASLLSLLAWGLSAGFERGRLTREQFQQFQSELESLAEHTETLWEPGRLEQIFQFTRKLVEVNHFVLLSKGPLALIVPEIGLKLTETSSNIVYTDNTESFKHGPKVILSGVKGEHPNTVYLIPTDETVADGLYKDIRSHFWHPDAPFEDLPDHTPAFQPERVFFVMFENSPPVPKPIYDGLTLSQDHILMLPQAPSMLHSLFMGIVTFQLVSYYLALIKGENPDNPMLEKAVTE